MLLARTAARVTREANATALFLRARPHAEWLAKDWVTKRQDRTSMNYDQNIPWAAASTGLRRLWMVVSSFDVHVNNPYGPLPRPVMPISEFNLSANREERTAYVPPAIDVAGVNHFLERGSPQAGFI